MFLMRGQTTKNYIPNKCLLLMGTLIREQAQNVNGRDPSSINLIFPPRISLLFTYYVYNKCQTLEVVTMEP